MSHRDELRFKSLILRMKRILLVLIAFMSVIAGRCEISTEQTRKAAAAGRKLYEQGLRSDAILSFAEVAEAVRQGDDDPAYCRELYIGGNACLESNRFIEALEFYTVALEIARKHKIESEIAGLSANIGVIYSIFRDYDRSIHYFREAYEALLKRPDEKVMPIVLANLVNSFSKSSNPVEARKYLKIQAQHPLPDKAVNQYHIYYNQGIIAAADGNPGGNLYYQQKALDVIDANKLPDLMRTDILDEMGHAYADLGQTDSALSLYKRMLSISETGGYVFQINEACRKIADLYRKEGLPDSAAYYLHRQAEMADSTFDMQSFNAARDKLESYEDFLAATRIESLGQSNRILAWSLGGVCLMLLLGGGWIASVMHLNRSLRKTRIVLVRKNEELMASLGMNGEDHVPHNDPVTSQCCTEEKTDVSASEAEGTDRFVLSPETQEIIRKRINAIMADTDIITDSEFSLNRLADMVKTNTKYVSLVINSTYGMTFKALLSERRIIEASRRLADREHYGHLTVTAIGAGVGFNSPTGFSDAFRRVNGMTPGIYRKLAWENGGEQFQD